MCKSVSIQRTIPTEMVLIGIVYPNLSFSANYNYCIIQGYHRSAAMNTLQECPWLDGPTAAYQTRPASGQ